MSYNLGKRGSDLIKSYEKLSFNAYLPTRNDVPTIGWGHTINVKMGNTINLQQAEEYFKQDTAEAVEAVNAAAGAISIKLSQSMFDALVSLVFNVGAGAVLGGSTIYLALKEKDYFAAWAGFTLWRKQRNRTTGKLENVLGLARRRSEEMSLFLEDGIPGNSKV